MNRFSPIFEPLVVRNMVIKNRIVMPPMGSNFAALDGTIRDDHIEYYRQRARGGVGLIIVENVCVDYPLGTNGTTQLRLDDDQYIPGLYRLTETLHRYGTALSVQLNHGGSGSYAGRLGGRRPVSASDVPNKAGGPAPRPLDAEELGGIAAAFGQAARRARQAGFDAVEIHAGHAYLLSQFLSPHYNRRTDEFGGSPENRARFPRMVIHAVRAAVGSRFPVGLRISADDMLPGGNTLQDTLILLEHLVEGVDILNVSAGLTDSIPYIMDKADLPDGWRVPMAAAVRRKFGKVVMASGNIRRPESAERILADGMADLIIVGRGLIADPEWVWKAETGREDSIRPCLSCNIGCCGHRMGGSRPLRCSVNPSVVEGEAWKTRRTLHPVSVAVIGAGIAGLEAACTAAECGCHVHVYEAGERVGGLARALSVLPAKKRLGDFALWLERRAAGLGNLHVHLGVRAGMAELEALRPDIVVVATGASPLLPPIPGLDAALAAPQRTVFTALDVINDAPAFADRAAGRRMVIAGGGGVGLDMAEFFSERGAAVSVVERLPVFGRDLDMVTRAAMLDMMAKNGVAAYPETRLCSVREHTFEVQGPNGKEELAFDDGFLCLGMRAEDSVWKSLLPWCRERGMELVNIGDSKAARRIMEGTREGRDVVELIERVDRKKGVSALG